ncbi:rRNA methyltransferase 3, mitochondrial-like [Ambystoma mexicanum]|uniref:rRNA methyltransferase 3, mitochondrial-like n=1 Tax=Ambystoma mexicanum TaxID=8296 RepID=UPI0037E851CD
MAALTRNMSAALLGRLWKCGIVLARRPVRALRRRPVQVLFAGEGVAARQNLKAPCPPVTSMRDQENERTRGTETINSAGRGHRGPQEPEGTGTHINRISSEPEPTLEGLRYEKAFADDKRLAKVVTIAKSKKFRDKHGKILLEGRRLIADALESGAVLQTLFFSTMNHLKELPLAKLKHVHLIKVKFEDIKTWSELVTPQGVIGIFARPDHSKMSYPATQLECSLPLILICDNVRDPGNLGTVLRSAAGAGCSKVLLTKGCVDAWEPKVLRAGMGAHFRIPVITNLEWEVLPNYLPGSTRVYVADNCSKNAASRQDSTSEHEDFSSARTGNIAAGKAGDYEWVSTHRKRKGTTHLDDYSSSGDESSESEEEESAGKVSLPELAVQRYDEQWAQNPTAIIIGGETQGLSLESFLLAERMGGSILTIPIVPGVESLNSAMAASILLFEGKRQLQLKVKPENRRKRLPV